MTCFIYISESEKILCQKRRKAGQTAQWPKHRLCQREPEWSQGWQRISAIPVLLWMGEAPAAQTSASLVYRAAEERVCLREGRRCGGHPCWVWVGSKGGSQTTQYGRV